MSVTLTERAALKMQRSLASRGKGLGIRLGVKTSGCSGMSQTEQRVLSGGCRPFEVAGEQRVHHRALRKIGIRGGLPPEPLEDLGKARLRGRDLGQGHELEGARGLEG